MAQVIKCDAIERGRSPKAVALKLADIAAEARTIVLDARREAIRIVSEARAEAEAVQQRAYRAGYDEGLDRGRGEARQAAAEQAQEKTATEADELIALAGKIIEEIRSAKAELLHRARCEMLDFSVALAEKIVGRVAVADISAAKANLAKALERAGCASEIVVRVSPRQIEGLRKHCAELTEAMSLCGEVRLVGDVDVAPGGVKLSIGRGEIDATIRRQFDNVVEALLGSPGPQTKNCSTGSPT